MTLHASPAQLPLYTRFEFTEGDLFERRLARRVAPAAWMTPDRAQAIIDIDPKNMKMPPMHEEYGVNGVVTVALTATVTHLRFIKPEGLPTGAYQLRVYERQFSSNGVPLPNAAPAEAVLHMTEPDSYELVLCRSSMCVQRGREVAAVLVAQSCGEVRAADQLAVIANPDTGEWVDPGVIEGGQEQMQRYIGVMQQLAQSPNQYHL